jgi:hypothetical protein
MPVLAMAAPYPDQRPTLPFDEANCITHFRHSAEPSTVTWEEFPRSPPKPLHFVILLPVEFRPQGWM